MVILRVSRVMPRVRGLLRGSQTRMGVYYSPTMAPTCSRCISRGPFGRDPFTQMEEFMKDMERKFKRDIESTVNTIFRDFPRTGASEIVPKVSEPGFGHMENVSTEQTFKMAFNFANAKPEDVKVTLKGRNLIVSSEAVNETENSKSSYAVTREYQLPEEVELEALESSLSPDGILTVEAPLILGKDSQTPHTIHINRE